MRGVQHHLLCMYGCLLVSEAHGSIKKLIDSQAIIFKLFFPIKGCTDIVIIGIIGSIIIQLSHFCYKNENFLNLLKGDAFCEIGEK